MQIRYRDAKGRFVSAAKASRRKKIISVLTEPVRVRTLSGWRTVQKPLGSMVGYTDSLKKLSRQVLTQKQQQIRHTPLPMIDAETEFELEELEESVEFETAYAEDFQELDALDAVEELLEDTTEWYH